MKWVFSFLQVRGAPFSYPQVKTHPAIFDRVLQEERQWNVSWLNAFRPVSVMLFLIPHLLLVGHNPGFWVLIVYEGLAIALFFFARSSERVARQSALAVPVLDMPFVFLKQWLELDLPEVNQRAIATFTIGIFVILVMLSAFTLNTRRLVLAMALAVVLEFGLQAKAKDSTLGKFGAVATLLVAGALCELAIVRRIQMVHRIAEERLRLERLERFFSPQVAAIIQREEEDFANGHLCEITVLFSDLRGFTAYSQNLAPGKVLDLLNEVHSCMVEVVFAHGGTLDKYIGDGLMAYFGAPIAQPDHAARALRCAHAMRSAFQKLNSIRAVAGKAELRLSIGLNTGPAVVGAMGAANRREFTAVGDTVNLAARMENLTRVYGSDILLSGDTASKAGEAFEVRHLGETPIRGRTMPVQVFTTVAWMDPQQVANP